MPENNNGANGNGGNGASAVDAPHRAPDPNTVGQDRARKTIVEAHDSDHGVYTENVDTVPTEQRLPTTQMPMAPDPSPFNLGPITGGGGGGAAGE